MKLEVNWNEMQENLEERERILAFLERETKSSPEASELVQQGKRLCELERYALERYASMEEENKRYLSCVKGDGWIDDAK